MENKKYFDKIDELYEKYLKVWTEVCSIESPTEHKDCVDKVGEYLLAIAKENGWAIDVCNQEKAGNPFTVTMNESINEQPLSLSGHIDTVLPKGAFGYPVVKMDDEKIYGPGVTDCKGGVVAGFMAMEVLSLCGYNKRPIKIIVQTDEESNSVQSDKQTLKYLCESAKGSVALLNLEGHTKGRICVQRKGIITCTLKVKGIEAHSSLCATDGANAILEMAYKIIELEKFKDVEGITCNCAIINGGTKANVVPGECSLKVNIRYATDEQYEYIKDYLKNLTKDIKVKGCSCELVYLSERPSMPRVQRNLELVDLMNKAFKKHGLNELEPMKRTGGSDAAYFTRIGIPCIDNIGTQGGRIHSEEEFALKTSLKDSAKRIIAVALEI